MKENLITLKGKIFYTEGIKEKLNSISMEINGKEKINLKPDTNTNEFLIQLKSEDQFKFELKDTNFVIIEKQISEPKGFPPYIEVTLKIAKLKMGETFVLENIYFTANKFDLLTSSYPALDALAMALKNNPNMKIEIQGHTSKTNEPEQFNINLSTQRANAVKKYLVAKGISEKRLSAKGYGYTKPKFTDESPEHQAANRRVEVKILEK